MNKLEKRSKKKLFYYIKHKHRIFFEKNSNFNLSYLCSCIIEIDTELLEIFHKGNEIKKKQLDRNGLFYYFLSNDLLFCLV